MVVFEEVLRSVIEKSEEDEVVLECFSVVSGDLSNGKLFKCELENRGIEKEEIRRHVLGKFLLDNGEVITEGLKEKLTEDEKRGAVRAAVNKSYYSWRDISSLKAKVLKVDKEVWKVFELMRDNEEDRRHFEEESFEEVVEKYRRAKEIGGEVLSLTREDLRQMNIPEYKDDLLEVFERTVNYAESMECSMTTAVASLKIYDEDFNEHYSRLKKEIEKISEKAEYYQRALKKID